jgi:YYY domain-containing protein
MTNAKRAWICDLLMLVVLTAATYFRVVGMNWDADQHLHPDERFLTMVETALEVRKCAVPSASVAACPADQVRWMGLGDYLDTHTSTLNPHNRGYGFFVYGDFPIVLVRYVAEWLGQTGYDQVHLVGRQISALSDLLTIVLMYFIAGRLYDRRVGLLAAAFSAVAVLQIQQSHYFTVDTVANLFIFLALLFATEIVKRTAAHRLLVGSTQAKAATGEATWLASPGEALDLRGVAVRLWTGLRGLGRNPFALLSLGFGVSLGLAVSSKLNAAPLALLLPAAFAARHFVTDRGHAHSAHSGGASVYWSRVFMFLLVGGAFAVLTFRFAQPYAFDGLGLNPAWLANIRDLRAQSSGDMDVPFALQWARRSPFFSFKNLTLWGLGLPLGILAWTGFAFMAGRLLKGELRHALLWGWTALYFGWQSLVFNPTMRYQLPVYPLLCMMAGWFLVFLWQQRERYRSRLLALLFPLASFLLGLAVLALTAAWAYAFTRIYTRPVTRVAATRWIYQNVSGPLNLQIEGDNGSTYQQPLPFPTGGVLSGDAPYAHVFAANANGMLRQIYLPHIASASGRRTQTLHVSLALQPDASVPDQPVQTATLSSDFPASDDPRGDGYSLVFDRPVQLLKGQLYHVRLQTDGALSLAGAAPINESDWDDGLPLRLGAEGYDAYAGLFQGDLNLQVYWDDNLEKLVRFADALTRGDYIFMSSNRQWATITRVPERYPLTTAYYRALIGCPADKDVIWCYNVARPGMFEGQLGFELAAVFESFPTLDIPGLLKWEVNDQFAEEAFTVYDHPKVLIFRKSTDFSAARVRSVLEGVDLQSVVYLTPRQAASYKSLMLPPVALARQQAGGTWSELFDYNGIQNRFQVVGLVIWYVFIFLVGLVTYPILRRALPGLGDKGYPVARILGLVLLACAAWLTGSAGVAVTRLTVAVVFASLAAVGLTMGWMQRAELADEWRSRRRYFLLVEGLFLAFFAFDLLIRLGNPDLWHPAKGGERPMDFSYFNAIIKSTTFPPYDPWFAGGYINYYYYGFVLVAMPVKLLGIVPSIAYNFILPTLFGTVALGAFCIGWNLLDSTRSAAGGSEQRPPASFLDSRLIAGVLAAALMVALGNLGTVRMIYRGLQQMAAPDGIIDPANIVQRLIWTVQGAANGIGGQLLPYGQGDWYWNPSRVIPPGPGNEITEFPLFTFLYSDLHAHMLAMPLALLALTWALGVMRARRISLLTLLIGGVSIGALYPTNLSDIYTFLPIGYAALAYAIWRSDITARWRNDVPGWLQKLILIGGGVGILTLLAYGLYQPYRQAYSQGYSAVQAWTGTHTPIWSYLTHWGVFLFIITFWLAWETRQWLAYTPAASLRKLRPYQVPIEAAIAAFLVGLLYLAYRGVQIGWVALPLAAWAGVLLLRPGLADAKRFVLFLIGTALLINIVVEIVVVRGDIGRMNTVFKFYLQGWALMSVSSAAAFAWLLPEVRLWLPGWRNVYQAGAGALLAGAALFTISAATDKISDRMAPGVPLTLDSITYMQYAQYADYDVLMDLSHDYRAIRWMQDNVRGSPVIVEANCPEYRWCTRFTIYTGLPGVVGWNWHQRQQRTLTPQLVEQRVSEIASFYGTSDAQEAVDFLERYDVRDIVVGQMERAAYPGQGLDKFARYDGKLWDAVYHEGDTTIYQVRR